MCLASDGYKIVLYDGCCVLCTNTVKFITRFDKADRFRFVALQSEAGKKLSAGNDAAHDITGTVVLIEDGRKYIRSTAILRILKRLSGLWPVLYVLIIVPAPVRDCVYKFIAGKRYRWFGRHNDNECMIAEENIITQKGEIPMTKRDVIRMVLDGEKPPYVPWSFSFTVEALEKLVSHFGTQDLDPHLHNHILNLGSVCGFFEDLGNDRFRDVFGVVWDRSVDKDIGNVEQPQLREPDLKGYTFPDPEDERFFCDIPEQLEKRGDLFRVYSIGFSLYERAWTLRGMENLMLDFIDNPEFVRELLRTIADYNIAQVRKALTYDIDAVYFGDDWGQQQGLQMGPALWREFIYPELKRMYATVRDAGKYVFIHSCGDVDELFDDLIGIGLNCFNPLQPEVMDVADLINRYRGRLVFHGGLSTQQTLPYGTVEDVRKETRRLIDLGREGGYILSPAHAVEGDVPLENMLAFIDEALNQPGFVR